VNAGEILQKTFGYSSFKSHQEAIIEHVVEGKSAFVLMPTGGGKSLCYQIPAILRSGTAIVISPLIALMHDQVQALRENGVKAAELNSGLNFKERQSVEEDLLSGKLDLLYVSPERIFSDGFIELLQEKARPALFAIDEAHCVSQWGHDFRPEYLQLSRLLEKFPDVPVMALTATADRPTRKEILEKLGLQKAKVFVEGFDRPNIQYRIALKQNPKKQIYDFISSEYSDEAGIVYCLSRARTEEYAEWLKEQGVRALPYHAGLNAATRTKHQRIFVQEEGVVMVATIAFGMGIDKPNVRFVVHADLPKSIESYYQETGRAGRDGLASTALLLYGLADLVQLRRMIDQGEAPDNRKRIERMKLSSLVGLCETTRCRRQVLLEYFGEELSNGCKNCDTCLSPTEVWDGTVVAQKALSVVYRTGQRFGQKHLIDVLSGTESDKVKQFSHQKLPTFGVGSDITQREWNSVFRQLVAGGFLEVDYEGYGGLRLTPTSKALLKGEETIEFRKDLHVAKSKKKKESKRSTVRSLDPASEDLFQKLRAERARLAKENGVPPYVIFHDKTLVEMAVERPKSLERLLEVQGVGEAKLERYGEEMLKVLESYADDAPLKGQAQQE